MEYRDRTYSNSKDYETATLQDGHQIIGYVGGSGPLPMLEGLTWQGRIAYSKATASYHPYAYDDFTAEFALPYSFTAPAFAQTEQRWDVAPFVGFSFTPYAEPDPLIDPSHHASRPAMAAGATLDMIFYKNFGFAI